MKHRFFAGAMAFCLILSLFPTAALATEDGENHVPAQPDSVAVDLIDSVTTPEMETEEPDEPKAEAAPVLPTEELPSEADSTEDQMDSVDAEVIEPALTPDTETEEPVPSEPDAAPVLPTEELPSEADSTEDQMDSVDAEVIEPVTAPVTEVEEPAQPEPRALTLPDTDSFHSNEEFKPYDPGYPDKDQYGNYTLRVPDLKDRLTFSTDAQNQLIGTLYAPGVSESKGWKDANKRWNNIDNGLCFAASSSNLISWYLNRYLELHPDDTHGFETHPERIFDRFRNGWDPAVGGDQKEALSWYFTGGFPSNNSHPNGSHLTGREDGGYLLNQIPNNSSNRWSKVSYDWDPQEDFSVFGSFGDNRFPYIEDVGGVGPGLPFSNMKTFSKHIMRQLHYGPCTISIITDQAGGGSGHAITLWGVDYDVNTELVTRIHVTDSDDTNTGLFSVQVVSGPNNEGVRLVQYPYHPPAGTPEKFTRIRDSIVLYAPDVVQSNQGYTGPDAEIQAVTPDADGSGVTVQVANISSSMLEYGYSYDKDPSHVIRWQSDSHFSGLKPDQYYFFARVKETSAHAAGGLSLPCAFRVSTPSPVAQDTVAALGLGTSLLRPYNETYQYIWYGTEHGEDGTAAEEPILWRILDTKTNRQTEGLFLISDKLYGTGNNGGLLFSQQAPYRNEYENSNARRWCQEFAQSNLNPLELSAILLTTKTDMPYGATFDGVPYILSNDKVFLPSAEEISNEAYGFGTDASRQARYRADSAAYWLRSPAAANRSHAGYVTADGTVALSPASSAYAARPAFNLDGKQVLYTAAVNNGLVTDQLGLLPIESVQSQDFRLVLKDTTRTFRVTSSDLTAQPGAAIALSYEGAKLSQSGDEFISVILMDTDGTTPIYYGKVAGVQSASGEISVTLPADLADGTYTLKVFNEQYNGEKKSGTASPFCDVTLTIKAPVAIPIAQVDLTLTAPVAGQVPQAATSKTEGCIVASTTWAPADTVFQANTDYSVSLELKAGAGYTFTKDTVITLNGEVVAAVADGGAYAIHYAAFPTTEDNGSGGGSDSDNGSNGDAGNGSDNGSNGDAGNGSDNGSNGDAGSNSGSGTGTNGGSGTGSGSNGKPETNPDSGSSHSTNNGSGNSKPAAGTTQNGATGNQNTIVNNTVSDANAETEQTVPGARPLVPTDSPAQSEEDSEDSTTAQAPAEPAPAQDDDASSGSNFLGWILLGVSIPVIGLILFFVLKRKKVKTR